MNKKCIFADVVRIFYGNRSFALLILPIIIAGYTAMNMWKPYHLYQPTVQFGFWGDISDVPAWVLQAGAVVLIVLNAILLNRLYNRNDFQEKNNYLPSLLYVVLLSFFHSFYYVDGFAIAQTAIILALLEIFKLSQNEDGRRRVFNAAFFLGVACTLYPLLITIVVVIFWMIWVLRPFVMRESVLTVLGFAIPLVYGGVYANIFNIPIHNEQLSSTAAENHLEDITILAGVVLFFLMLAMGTLLLKFQQSSIRLKKLFRIIFILIMYDVLLSILEYFVFNKTEVSSLIFIPLMFVLPYAFGYKKQRDVTTAFFYLVFLFSVGKFLYPLAFWTVE